MKLARIHGAGDVRVDEVDAPVAGPADVIVKIAACGVCGTDVERIRAGGTGNPRHAMPMPLGHEASGVIVDAGAEVADLRPGMRVILNPMCTAPNTIGNGGSEGAFGDYLLVRNAKLNRALYEVPEGMSLGVAALTEPMAVAKHGVNRAGPRPDSRCVVFGVGPIGCGVVWYLKQRGVGNIVAVDMSPARLETAKSLGAADVLVAGQRELAQALTEIHGVGASGLGPTAGSDIYFDCTSAAQVMADCIDVARQGAKLLMLGIHQEPIPMNMFKVVVKELQILGACGYPDEYPQVIADLSAMGPAAENFVSHRLPFSRFDEAVAIARSPTSAKVLVEFG